jgi:hypothetical protein
MSRANVARIKKLERAGNRVADFSRLTDEQLLEAECNYDPERTRLVLAAYRVGGLDAAGEELLRVTFGDDPEQLALALEADRRGDDETVARMLAERYANEI